MRFAFALLLALSVAAAAVAAPLAAARAETAEPITIFAAASLKTALDEAVAVWSAETGRQARISYAGSAQLARQIAYGAPADVFLSANTDWMDYLEGRGLIDTMTRADVVGNRLVMIAPAPIPVPAALSTPDQTPDQTPGGALAALRPGDRLAVALVRAVPAGIYAKAALTQAGVWAQARAHLAQTDNVRLALALVARGESPLGVVYATDAAAESRVSVVHVFPEDAHPAIVYPAAVAADARAPETAAGFVAWLRAPAAQTVFAAHGFTHVDP